LGLEIKFTDPKLQARVDQWVHQSGRPVGQLLEEAVATYLNWDAQRRARLAEDKTYDGVGLPANVSDIKVIQISFPEEQISPYEEHFKEKAALRPWLKYSDLK